jgi:membrane-associated phospholipid phosphatase
MGNAYRKQYGIALLNHAASKILCCMKRALVFTLLCALPFGAAAQEDTTEIETQMPLPRQDWASVTGPKVYYRPKIDLAITLPCAAFSIYSFPIIYSKPESDSAKIAGLSKENIPAFDRWAVKHSDKASELSDIAFYGSMPYPIVLLLDKDIRRDAGRVGGLYLEAMAITGLLYTGSNMVFDRYRPETYDVTKPFSERLSGNEKNAFFAGHVALVGTSTFFTASIYDIYHPNSKLKWLFYGVAIAATGTTIYLRHEAGKHFPSDLLVGTLVGVGSGMLVPRLHRAKPEKKTSWFLTPQVGRGLGFAATYRF